MQKPRDQNLFCRMMLVLAAVLFAASLLVSSCSAEPAEAKLVLINDAVSEGAVCLDGTAPGYYFRPGQLHPSPADMLTCVLQVLEVVLIAGSFTWRVVECALLKKNVYLAARPT